MPAADFCRTVRVNCFTLSPDSGTCSRPPEVSSTAFNAQPPDLQPALLMEMDFAIVGPLVLRRMPPIRFLFIGSRLCSTLLSDSASRRRPCASLSLLLHQDVKGTSTPKLLNMLGTPTYVVLPKENHMQLTEAATLDRKSGGAERICGAPFVGPAPTGLQPSHPPNPPGNINLPFVIPGFQEYSVEPQIRSAALPRISC